LDLFNDSIFIGQSYDPQSEISAEVGATH